MARLLSASTKMKADSLHGVVVDSGRMLELEIIKVQQKWWTNYQKKSLPDNDLLELKNLRLHGKLLLHHCINLFIRQESASTFVEVAH